MRLPLILRIRFSRQLALWLLFVHGLAMLAVLPLAIPWFVRAVLLVVLAASLAHAMRRLRRQSGMELQLGTKGELKVGAGGTASLSPETAVLPGVTILVVRSERGRQTHVLSSDALSPDEYRRLRVWLKVSAAA